jgi:hypothetical protein
LSGDINKPAFSDLAFACCVPQLQGGLSEEDDLVPGCITTGVVIDSEWNQGSFPSLPVTWIISGSPTSLSPASAVIPCADFSPASVGM